MSVKPTGLDIVNKFQALKLKIDSLSSAVANVRGSENVEQALSIHNIALDIKSSLDVITSEAQNVQKPVPLENGLVALKITQENVVTAGKVIDGLIAKKALLEALPVANFKNLITLDIQGIHSSIINTADAVLTNGPDDPELQRKGRAARDALDEMFKKGLAVYAK